MQFIEDLGRRRANGRRSVTQGTVLRASATNFWIWATGQDIPFVPNKRFPAA